MPGCKDFVSVRNPGRVHVQKRLVLSHLNEMYHLFMHIHFCYLPGDQGDRRYELPCLTACGRDLRMAQCPGQSMVKSRTIVKCSWEDKFGSLLERFEGLTVEKIQISKNENLLILFI